MVNRYPAPAVGLIIILYRAHAYDDDYEDNKWKIVSYIICRTMTMI